MREVASRVQDTDCAFLRQRRPAPAGPLFAPPTEPAATTSLDPHESKSHRQAEPVGGTLLTPITLTHTAVQEFLRTPEHFRHSGWSTRRGQVAAALKSTLVSDSRIERFNDCGKSVAVFRKKDDPAVLILKGNYCRDRFCVPCQAARASTIRQNLFDYIHERKLRFLTLTIHSTSQPLHELLQHLYTSFSKFRRSKTWKQHVHGGVCFLEIKYNERLSRWHPHFHILFEGRYFPQKEIAQTWKAITHTSYICDVRDVPDKRRIVNYLLAYVTKSFKHQVAHNHDLLCEQMNAMRGTTTVFTFGAWRGLKLTQQPDPGELEYVGHLYTIITRALNKDLTSLAILQQLLGGCSEITPRPPPSN